MPQRNYNHIVFVVVIFYALIYLFVVANYGGAFTCDGQLAQKITLAWKDGHNPLTDHNYFGNAFPYPPAFHLTLALIPMNVELIFGLIQILLFPCIIMVTYWLARWFYGDYAGVVAVALAISGFAFWDHPGQTIPNAVDLLLLPIIFYAYFKKKNITFVLVSTYLIYNHLFYPLGPVLALCAHSIITKRGGLQNFLFIGVLCLPLVYIYIPYAPLFLSHSAKEQTVAQYLNFKDNPVWAICYLGYPLFVSAFFTAQYFIKEKKSEIDWIMLVWILSFVPMMLKFPHRAMTYLSQPLAIIGGMLATNMIKDSRKDLFLIILFTIATLYALVQASYIVPYLRVPMTIFFDWVFIGWT